MSKRPRVPAALHAEISEYSALLRALRNQDTLDLTSQLIRAHTASAAATEDDVEDEDISLGEDASELPLSEATSQVTVAADTASLGQLSSQLKRKHPSGKRKLKGKPRDTWTRWPLMAGDVHVPEWTLADEVKTLAVQHIKRSLTRRDTSPSDAELLEDLDDDFANTLLPPASVGVLADGAATHLARILARIAAHKPPAAESMQNRFAPFGWERVMAVMSSSGLVDANVMQNVQRRMEVIYGSSKSRAVHRVECRTVAKLEFRKAIEPHELSFLRLAYKPPPPPKRKRGPYKKRKIKSAETIESSDELEDAAVPSSGT